MGKSRFGSEQNGHKKWNGCLFMEMIKRGLLISMLLLGIILFGIILRGSFRDHYGLLHFSAHFGTSFLIAVFVFNFCRKKKKASKTLTVIVVFTVTLLLGSIYKYFEIRHFSSFRQMSLFTTLLASGFYVSLSQNISGILAAFIFVVYFDRPVFR